MSGASGSGPLSDPPEMDLVGKEWIRKDRMEWLENIPVFDLANGPPESARSLVVDPWIPTAYHWVPIAGVKPEDAIKHVDGYILSHYAQLMKNPPFGVTPAIGRKVAMCLGVSRAVATSFYELSQADLIPGEVAAPLLAATALEGGGYSLKPTAACVGVVGAIMRAGLSLTEEERAVVSNLKMSSIGTLPLQGRSLMLTQHHYLSDPQGQCRKAYRAVEMQFWRAPEVAAWYQANVEVIQDAMWHKAIHPVNIALKYRAATRDDIRKMLIEAGAGSAAARLPAVEPEVSAATNYMKLFDKVRTAIQQFGGSINADILEAAIASVKFYPPGIENPEQPTDRADFVPRNVTNRRTAVEWVRQVVERNSAMAAWCYGFYVAMSDQSVALGAGGQVDTTLKYAFSLAKLKTTHVGSFFEGTQSYLDYQAARIRRRERGNYEAPKSELVRERGRGKE